MKATSRVRPGELMSSRPGKLPNCCVKEIKNDVKAICDSLKLANSLNSHFSFIGPKLASKINCDNGPSHLRDITRTAEPF